MKAAREYRSLAWDQLRANFKQSSLVVLVSALIGLIGAGAIIGTAVYLILSPGFVSASVFSAVTLAMLLTAALLGYYEPVWFMALVRKQPERWYDVRTPYFRALIAAFFVIVPTVLSQLVNGASRAIQLLDSISPTVKLILALMIFCASMVALVFTVWYSYSLSLMLPYRVYDYEDRSVFKALGDTFRMMKGYRWRLFCVDFYIVIWPLIVIYVLAFVLGIFVALKHLEVLDGNAFLGGMVVTITLFSIVLLVNMFMIAPMTRFAHVLFYDDLREEKESMQVEN